MVVGLVSRLSLANHSDSESFLVVHTLFSQDRCQKEGFWEVVGHVVSPFELSRTLLVGGCLLVSCSLPGPPVIKQLMQMVIMVPGRGGSFNQCASPNSATWEAPKGRQCWSNTTNGLYYCREEQRITWIWPTKANLFAIFQPFILQMEKPNLSSCTSKIVIELGMDPYPKTVKGKPMPFPY